MAGTGRGARLQHEAEAAIGAVDLALAFHVQEHPRMTQRPLAAVAGHRFAVDIDDLGRFHLPPLRRVAPQRGSTPGFDIGAWLTILFSG